MILKSLKNRSFEDVLNNKYDLFIASSGFETRASYLSKIASIDSKKKICISFTNNTDIFSRKANDRFYNESGFQILISSSDSYSEIKLFLTDFISRQTKPSLNILIDYSSMTRVWYSYILSFFSNGEFGQQEIILTFSYSHSYYIPPPAIAAYKSLIAPIEGYYSILPPIQPTALILGLGYIKMQAFGLTEYFEAEPFAFINRPTEDDAYFSAVMQTNNLLLESISKSNIFYYTIYNLEYSHNLLSTLCKDLQLTKRIVLAPCGPKPFTFLCLVTSLRLGNIDVWRISASSNDVFADKIPDGNFSIVDVVYSEN